MPITGQNMLSSSSSSSYYYYYYYYCSQAFLAIGSWAIITASQCPSQVAYGTDIIVLRQLEEKEGGGGGGGGRRSGGDGK